MAERRTRRTRVEATEENRRAVLAAAGRVFRRHGYLGATLEQIADEAGFSKGVVYSQFGSKPDLFFALLEERIEQRAASHRELMDTVEVEDAAASMARLGVMLDRSDRAWRLAVIEFRLAVARDDELAARYRSLHQRSLGFIAEVLAHMAANAVISSAHDPRTLATAAFIFECGLALEDLAADEPLDQEAAVVLAARMIGAAVPTSQEATR